MINFSFKTKVRLYLSLFWIFFSFFIATTYSKLNGEIILSWFDLYNVYWHIFYLVSAPVWIYWIVILPYKWVKKFTSSK